MTVIIQKPDLDTCLTALILDVEEADDIRIVRRTSDADLQNPDIICIEAGGSGMTHLNNFDHHDSPVPLPPACRQAFQHTTRPDPEESRRLERVVEYVSLVDDRPGDLPRVEFPSLSALFSGMLIVEHSSLRQFIGGIRLLQRVLELNLDPFGSMPDREEWRLFREAKRAHAQRVKEIPDHAEYYESHNGTKVGYCELDLIGGLGHMYAQGCAVAIMFNPSYGDPPVPKYTVAGNVHPVYHLVAVLDKLEPGWGGKETIIGSPRTGTQVSKEQLLAIVLEHV